MLFLMIGIVVVVAVGALLKQQARHALPNEAPAQPVLSESDERAPQAVLLPLEEPDRLVIAGSSEERPASIGERDERPASSASSEERIEGQAGLPAIQEEIDPLTPVLAAAPISSPSAVASATYSSAAPTALGGDSPYSYGALQERKKSGVASLLLRWCGKTGSLQIGDFVILGPVTYWSDGSSTTSEPCCIDIILPVEYPDEETPLPADGAVSLQAYTTRSFHIRKRKTVPSIRA